MDLCSFRVYSHMVFDQYFVLTRGLLLKLPVHYFSIHHVYGCHIGRLEGIGHPKWMGWMDGWTCPFVL